MVKQNHGHRNLNVASFQTCQLSSNLKKGTINYIFVMGQLSKYVRNCVIKF